MFPLQSHDPPKKIPEAVYMAAYRVYSKVYAPQEAMIDLDGRGCRGGFGTLEFIAFLYASGFPEAEWRIRVDECFKSDAFSEHEKPKA